MIGKLFLFVFIIIIVTAMENRNKKEKAHYFNVEWEEQFCFIYYKEKSIKVYYKAKSVCFCAAIAIKYIVETFHHFNQIHSSNFF